MADLVGAILLDGDRVLLGRRAAHKSYAGCWDIFGGHVEVGESLPSALSRELDEELGIQPIDAELLRSFTTPADTTLHVYLVRRWAGEPAVADDEHSAIGWFTLKAAAALTNLVADELSGLFVEVAAGLSSGRS